jgi:hypothetical protein
MQFLSPAFLAFVCLPLCQAILTQPGTSGSIAPSNESIEIDVETEMEIPKGLDNVSLVAVNDTHSFHGIRNSSSLIGMATNIRCEAGNPTSIYNETSSLPTAATQGSFFNYTASTSATGSFRTPSQVDFTPFTSSSSTKTHPELSLLVVVISCYLAAAALF